MQLHSTIIKSHTTEKSSDAQSKGKYSFLVSRDATKVDIKNAIREIYGADAATVRTMIAPKKTRLLKNRYVYAKRPVLKKAIVTLKGKATIDPNKIKETKSKK